MSNVAENRILLFEEVQELRAEEKKHHDAMWTAKEGRRLAELRLEEANKECGHTTKDRRELKKSLDGLADRVS